MSSQLIQMLRTKEDLEILRGELMMLENALYQTTNKYNNVLRNDIRSWVSEIIVKESKNEGMDRYIKKMKGDLLEVPILTVSIYFEPSNLFIETISNWLKNNIDERLVVDILLNSASLGGIQLSYKGKYLDLSLRKSITNEFENMRLEQSK